MRNLLLSSTNMAAMTHLQVKNYARVPLLSGRMKFESVELHGKFYAIGGILSGEGLQHIVECYDYLANTWTPVRPPRQLRHTHCAVSFDGHLYIIGGIHSYSCRLTHNS